MASLKKIMLKLVGRREFATKDEKWAARMEVRRQVLASEAWERGSDMAQRKYDSYEDYVAHQSSKLDKIIHRLEENKDADLDNFVERFENCAALKEAKSVLCLGARLGTEVKALHKLGYFAVGIDLNPGSKNEFVLPGDFHHVVFPDVSVDAIYTNALDHVFDLERVVGEVKRMLRPDGVFVADLICGYEEGFMPGDFESIHWQKAGDFAERISQMTGFALENTRDLGRINRDSWIQAVFRKPAVGAEVDRPEEVTSDPSR